MRETSVCMKWPFLIFNIIFGIRNLCATQSFLLTDVLEVSDGTSSGANVVVQGIEMVFVIIPSHKIMGGLILALAIFAHGAYHAAEEVDLDVLGVVVIGLSVLGAYGSQKEKKWALILYCVGAFLPCFIMMVIAAGVADSQSQIREDMMAHFAVKKPLDKADENVQNTLEVIQSEFKCCGLYTGYHDWGEHIPGSCHCPEYYKKTSKCIEVPNKTANVSIVVYSEPCLPHVLNYVEKAVNDMLGILFGFAFFVMIGVVMSVVLLCQVRRQQRPTLMTFSVNFSEPEYKELPDPTENI